MPTPEYFRRQADICLRLSLIASDDEVSSRLIVMAQDYKAKGVNVVGINSNDAANYPDDSPVKMVEEVQNIGYAFPYLSP